MLMRRAPRDAGRKGVWGNSSGSAGAPQPGFSANWGPEGSAGRGHRQRTACVTRGRDYATGSELSLLTKKSSLEDRSMLGGQVPPTSLQEQP